jgi:hypothetical protein
MHVTGYFHRVSLVFISESHCISKRKLNTFEKSCLRSITIHLFLENWYPRLTRLKLGTVAQSSASLKRFPS